MHIEYRVLHVKAHDGTGRKFAGVATTPTEDRQADIMEPLGMEFQNPMPLLLFHDATAPVGFARFGAPTREGVTFEAEIADVGEPGRLQQTCEYAAQLVKHRLIRGVSIGFRPIAGAVERLKSGGIRYLKSEILELSLVAIPANAEATITTIKHFDSTDPPAALGLEAGSVLWPHVPRSGSGDAVQPWRSPEAHMRDATQDYKATRDQAFAELSELMKKSNDSGETMDAATVDHYEDLKTRIKALDDQIKRNAEYEQMLRENATAAPTPPRMTDPLAQFATMPKAAAPPVITVTDTQMPPGIGFTRYAIAKIFAQREGTTAIEFAKQRWPSHTALHNFIQGKANVPAGTTTDANWASPLVYNQNLPGEFLEYLRPRTLVGRIPGLRRVPFNVRYASQTSGAVANWVGQGKGKPVTSFATTSNTLGETKIAAISVITEELARSSSPSAETLVRDELARAVIERMDIDFIDPAQAAVANVQPASITNGVSPLSSSGTSADNVRTDIAALLGQFIEQNVDPTGLVLLMPNTLAMVLGLQVNSLGQPVFPSMGNSGGTLLGIPVIASQYLANASGAGNLVVALNAPDIFLADDGRVNVDSSREASIQMTDAPTVDSTTATGASLVSMYQTNSIAIRAERFINWAKGRTNAVSYIDDVNWGSVGSP